MQQDKSGERGRQIRNKKPQVPLYLSDSHFESNVITRSEPAVESIDSDDDLFIDCVGDTCSMRYDKG